MNSSSFAWPNGLKAAISLSYDDALPQHHRTIAPLLKRHGIRGTFYTTINGRFLEESKAWSEVAQTGHELGNHTLFHPCYGEKPGDLPWLDPGYNLRDYSPKRWEDEVRVANWALQQVDGRTARSYGNTCGNRFVGQGEARVCLDDFMLKHFVAARGSSTGKMIDPNAADLTKLGCVSGDRRMFSELREELCRVREAESWIIYCIHGVGPGEHGSFIEAGEHAQLVEWIAAQGDFWAVSVAEAAAWIARK